jgi:hypothetical protein
VRDDRRRDGKLEGGDDVWGEMGGEGTMEGKSRANVSTRKSPLLYVSSVISLRIYTVLVLIIFGWESLRCSGCNHRLRLTLPLKRFQASRLD